MKNKNKVLATFVVAAITWVGCEKEDIVPLAEELSSGSSASTETQDLPLININETTELLSNQPLGQQEEDQIEASPNPEFPNRFLVWCPLETKDAEMLLGETTSLTFMDSTSIAITFSAVEEDNRCPDQASFCDESNNLAIVSLEINGDTTISVAIGDFEALHQRELRNSATYTGSFDVITLDVLTPFMIGLDVSEEFRPKAVVSVTHINNVK